MTTLSDDILLQMISSPAERDNGFRALMNKYGRELYWNIRRIVIDHDDTEDVFQECAIKILNKIDSFRAESALRNWLLAIATREALQFLRSKKSFFQSIDDIGEQMLGTLESQTDLDADEAQMLFNQALLQLPTRQRVAFNLRYYDELSYDEIAAITGSSVATLKSNYHYAVKKIESYIKDNATQL